MCVIVENQQIRVQRTNHLPNDYQSTTLVSPETQTLILESHFLESNNLNNDDKEIKVTILNLLMNSQFFNLMCDRPDHCPMAFAEFLQIHNKQCFHP